MYTPSSPTQSRRRLLQPALAMLSFLLLLTAASSAAHADLKLCNGTTSRIGVAIGYQDQKGWTTEGWWTIASQTCEVLLKGPVPSSVHLRACHGL